MPVPGRALPGPLGRRSREGRQEDIEGWQAARSALPLPNPENREEGHAEGHAEGLSVEREQAPSLSTAASEGAPRRARESVSDASERKSAQSPSC